MRTNRSSIGHIVKELCAALLLIGLTGYWLNPVSAADAPNDPSKQSNNDQSQETSGQEQSESDRPLSGSAQRQANDKGGVFRPSESISEDLSITFPVDI